MQLCYPAAWQSPAGEGKGKKRAFFAYFEPFHPLLRPAKQATTVPAQCATLFAQAGKPTADFKRQFNPSHFSQG